MVNKVMWIYVLFFLVFLTVLLVLILTRSSTPAQRTRRHLNVITFYEHGDFTGALNRLYPHDHVTYYAHTDVPMNLKGKTIGLVINTSQPDLTPYSLDEVWGLTFEPREFLGLNDSFLQYAQQNIQHYLITGDGSSLPSLFRPHYTFIPYVGVREETIPWSQKPHLISIMVSEKKIAPGHRYRYELCEALLQLNIPVHVFGRGAHHFGTGDHIKGEFNDTELYDTYKFTLAIENFSEPHYLSEKITNPISCHCIPIYWGCPNVEQYLGSKCAHFLKGDLQYDVTFIKNIYEAPENYFLDLHESRYELKAGKANLSTYLLTNKQ